MGPASRFERPRSLKRSFDDAEEEGLGAAGALERGALDDVTGSEVEHVVDRRSHVTRTPGGEAQLLAVKIVAVLHELGKPDGGRGGTGVRDSTVERA